MTEKLKIAVAGTGYVGLSLAVLLSQHNEVHALGSVEKVGVAPDPKRVGPASWNLEYG